MLVFARGTALAAALAAAVSASVLAAQATPAVTSSAPPNGGGLNQDARSAFLRLIDRPRVPMDPAVRPLPDVEGLVHEHVSFASEAGERVPTLVVKARTGNGRRPVIIVLHGTGSRKEDLGARLRGYAAQGFVAVAIDGRFHGERTGNVPGPSTSYTNAILRTYHTGQGRPFLYDSVWDVMRLIDYLATRGDVDPSRIGLTGNSKGGMETYLTAAVDPRVAVAVPFIGVQSFGWALDHAAWDSRAWTIRGAIDSASKTAGEPVNVQFMRKFYDRVAPGVYSQFDGPAMLPLIAPRPLLVVNGDSDARTPMGGVRACAAAADSAYSAAGVGDKFQLYIQQNTGHEITPAAYEAGLQWFVRWLAPSK